MKLFLKWSGQQTLDILDDRERPQFTAQIHTEPTKQKIVITTVDGKAVSSIVHNHIIVHHFTVRCVNRIYILIPKFADCFSFTIYGSTYRFAGNILSGRFSLFDVDKSPIMTLKKCWCAVGDGYEMELYRPEDEALALSVAVCAVLYASATNEKPALT